MKSEKPCGIRNWSIPADGGEHLRYLSSLSNEVGKASQHKELEHACGWWRTPQMSSRACSVSWPGACGSVITEEDSRNIPERPRFFNILTVLASCIRSPFQSVSDGGGGLDI